MEANVGKMQLTCLGRYGPYPAADGASSGYLLQADGLNILLECGSGVFSRLQRYCAFTELDAIILSHLHVDHTSDMRVLSQALRLHDDKHIDVYLPPTPEADFQDIAKRNFNAHTISDGKELQLGGISLTFHKAMHPLESYTMSITHAGRRLFFTGDTNWYGRLVEQAGGADLLLCDCALLEEIWKPDMPHLSPRLAGKLAKEAAVGRLLMTHIVPGVGEDRYLAEVAAEYPEAEIIVEGQVYSV